MHYPEVDNSNHNSKNLRGILRRKKSMRRFKPILVIAILFAFLISPALAEKGNCISPDQVDLVKILAPPPADNSPQTQTEIQELTLI
jgi:hypothetical protein